MTSGIRRIEIKVAGWRARVETFGFSDNRTSALGQCWTIRNGQASLTMTLQDMIDLQNLLARIVERAGGEK
jgi:hypothetical protein